MNSTQPLLFDIPSIAETGVWCQLADGIDPAEWAGLCRQIGQLSPKRFAETRDSFKKHVRKLFALKCEYGVYSLIAAIKRASSVNAYGAQYIENILYQDMTPERNHPPVRLKKEYLNRICLEEPILAEYDTFIIKRRKRS